MRPAQRAQWQRSITVNSVIGAITIIAVASLVGACGIPTDSSARPVPVEVGLKYAVTPIPTPEPGITERASGLIYFVDERGELTAVERAFDITRAESNDSDQAPNNERRVLAEETLQREALAKGLVEQLLAGPTDEESARGIRTYWPGDVLVLDVDITVAGTAIVEITDESRFEVSPLEERRYASSELVFTLTEITGVGGVRLTSPTSDLRLVTNAGPATALSPVSRAQYGDDEALSEEPEAGSTSEPEPDGTSEPEPDGTSEPEPDGTSEAEPESTSGPVATSTPRPTATPQPG